MTDELKNLDLSWMFPNGVPTEGESKVRLPEGAGFVNSTTAKFHTAVLWKMFLNKGVDPEEIGVTDYDHKETTRGGTNILYWRSYDAAKEAEKKTERFPSQVWSWIAPSETILGWGAEDRTPQDVFGERFQFDIDISSLARQGKNTHVLHYVSLPSFIQAFAVGMNILPEPLYDYEEFVKEGMNVPDDADPGNAVANRLSDKYFGSEGELWQARVRIWNALGESNPSAYTVSADRIGKYEAESHILRQLLSPVYNDADVWAKWSRVNDPTEHGWYQDQGTGDTVRKKLQVCLALYRSKAEAEKAVSVFGDTQPSGNHPPIPAQWQGGTESMVVEWISEWIATNNLEEKALPVVLSTAKEKKVHEAAAMTPEEMETWIKHVVSK